MSRPENPVDGRALLYVLVAAALLAWPRAAAAQTVNVTYEGSLYGRSGTPFMGSTTSSAIMPSAVSNTLKVHATALQCPQS